MTFVSRLIIAAAAAGFSTGSLAADPVKLPCAPNCTPIPPCELNPNKPGCPGQGGPIGPTPNPAPDPPKKDKVAPVVPPPPPK